MTERAVELSKFEECGNILSVPVFSKGRVYFGAIDTYFYCLDIETGQKIWDLKTGGKIFSSPLIDNDVVYFGSYDQYLYAVNPENKEILWKIKAGGGIASKPAVSGDLIFFGSEDTYLYAASKSKKSIVWRFKTGDEVICDPVVSGGKIYFGSMDGYFYCVDITGALLWKFRTGDSILMGEPLVTEEFVCFGSSDNNLYCLNLNGEFKWALRTGDMVFNNASIHGNTVYFGSRDRYVYAIDAETGSLLWKTMTESHIVVSKPIRLNECIYVGSNKMYCLSKEGQILWKSELCDIIPGGPAEHEGNLYFGATDTKLRCMSAEDGHIVWRFNVNSSKIVSLSDKVRPLSWDSNFFESHDEKHGQSQISQQKEPYGVSETLLYGMGIGSIDIGGLPENKKYAEPSVGGVYQEVQGGGAAYTPDKRGKKKDKELEVFLHNMGLQG